MVEAILIDLKALLVEREDCDAGTVQKLREALTQGSQQFRVLRDISDVLRKKLETAQPPALKKWHLKLGVALFFLGHTQEGAEHLRQAEGALANFYLGRALVSRREFDEALKAFERAEKSGYTGGQVKLQRVGIFREKGDFTQARSILAAVGDMASHSAEYHFQEASLSLIEGDKKKAVKHLERAVELEPGHSAALFMVGHLNDQAGNDEEALRYYERCLNQPPVHVGTLINLGVLYEDFERFDKAAECYRRILAANPADERARLFLKDSQASQTMYYHPDEEHDRTRYGQALEIPVTDFELSVRSRNCLKKMNIKTLGDLTRVNEQHLLSSKNFGETSLSEINEMMQSRGLHLGQSLEEGAQYDSRFRSPPSLNEEQQAILNKPVTELNLSVRARKCMNRLGINSIGELVQRSPDDLLESKNFGQTSLTEVRERLQQFNLSLRGD